MFEAGQRVRIARSDEQHLYYETQGQLATVLIPGPIAIVQVDGIGIRGCCEHLLEHVVTAEHSVLMAGN